MALLIVFNNKLVSVPGIAALGLPLTFADCIDVSGVVLGVKSVVYTATPFTIRKLLIYPQARVPPGSELVAFKVVAATKFTLLVVEIYETPLIFPVTKVPVLVNATCCH